MEFDAERYEVPDQAHEQDPVYERIYSGPEKSGICKCGCPWDAHHLCIVMRKEYRDATGEAYIPDECCAYGFNEVGGMKYNPETQEYEDHCHGYEDRGV